MTEESPVVKKCEMCLHILQKNYKGDWVCINTHCHDYFEKALRQSVMKEVPGRVPTYCQVEGCGRVQELGDGVWACRVHQHDLFKTPAYTFTDDGPYPRADDVKFGTSGIGRAPGVKLDKGKPPIFTEFLMQFPRAIRMVTRVGAKGTEAPGHVRSGWKAVLDGYLRYSDAQARHLIDEAIAGSEARLLDEKEDGSDPVEELIWQAATVAWNDLARLELLIRENRAAAERLDPRAAP